MIRAGKNPIETRAAWKPGRYYAIAHLELRAIIDAISRAFAAQGFRTNEVYSEKASEIRAEQTATWFRVLTRTLGQEFLVELSCETTSARTVLRVEQQWFRWYSFLLCALAVPVGLCWIIAFSGFFQAFDIPSRLSLRTLVLPWFAVIMMLGWARMIGSEKALRRWLTGLRAELQQHGALLDVLPRRGLSRQSRAGCWLLVFVGIVSALAFYGTNLSDMKLNGETFVLIGIVVVLLVILAMGIKTLVMVIRRVGADDRFAAVAAGLLTTTAILFPVTSQLSFRVLGQTDNEFWTLAFRANALLASNVDPVTLENGTVVERSRVLEAVSQGQLFVGLLISIGGVLWMLGALLFFRALRGAKTFVDYCHRMQSEICTSHVRAATAGAGFLGEFRKTFAVTWFLTSFLICLGAASLLDLGLEALTADVNDAAPKHQVGPVLSTSYALSFLYGRSDCPAKAVVLARVAWVAAALALPVLVAVSSGHLLFNRRTTLRRLLRLESANKSDPAQARLGRFICEMSVGRTIPIPAAVVTPDTHAFARAHEFGLWKRRQFIEVSSGATALLESVELEAVTAHELAHLTCGHSRRHGLLRLMGRLTLMGDSFVGALADSFGYEAKADACAIQLMGVNAESLKTALIKLQVAGSLKPLFTEGKKSELRSLESGMARGILRNLVPWNVLYSIKSSFRAWLMLLVHDSALAYWHPALQDRIISIDELGKEFQKGTPACERTSTSPRA